MKSIEQVTTARLIARRICDADFGDLHRLYSDPLVVATLGGNLRTAEETRSWLRGEIDRWEKNGFGVWTLRGRDDEQFVGRAGLRRIEIDRRSEVEVLYAIASEHWRVGYATEIARESVRVGFEELRLPSLVAFTLPTNAGSRRVMENAGFRYERDIEWAGLRHVLYRQFAPR